MKKTILILLAISFSLNAYNQCNQATVINLTPNWQNFGLGWKKFTPSEDGTLKICPLGMVYTIYDDCSGSNGINELTPGPTGEFCGSNLCGDQFAERLEVFAGDPVYIRITAPFGDPCGDWVGLRFIGKGDDCLDPAPLECNDIAVFNVNNFTNEFNFHDVSACSGSTVNNIYGQDRVFELVVSTPTDITIYLNSNKPNRDFLGVFQACSDCFSGCFLDGCVGYSQTTAGVESVVIPNAFGSYLIVADWTPTNTADLNGGIEFELQAWCGDPCADAETLQCGVTKSSTTIGQSNQFNAGDYTTCYSGSLGYNGPDRVFKIVKPSNQGNLMINLFSPGSSDLNVFVFDACGGPCLARGATLANTNLEYVIDVDPPLQAGTYYIVVDGATNTTGYNFSLTVTCGDLDCSNAIEIGCGETIVGLSNQNGQNNTSIYNCTDEGTLPGYTGKEMVYFFNLNKTATVTIDLTNPTPGQDFDLLLLGSCAESLCARSSINAPGQAEQIIATSLSPGKYYIVVEGWDGSQGNFDLSVNWECCADEMDNNCEALQYQYVSAGANGSVEYQFTLNFPAPAPAIVSNWVTVDGVTVIPASPTPLQNFTYTFPGPGTYVVCYNATKPDGCLYQCCRTIEVLDVSGGGFNCLHGDDRINVPTKVKWIDGDVYVSGSNADPGSPQVTFATFSRYDALGNLVWAVELDSPSVFIDFVPTEDNAFLLIGRTPVGATPVDNRSILAKIDQNGNQVFCNYIPNQGREFMTAIVRHPFPSNPAFPYYIGGFQNRTATVNTEDDAFLFNLNNAGTINWKKLYTSLTDNEFGRFLFPLNNGHFLLVGNNASIEGYILEVDGNGADVKVAVDQDDFRTILAGMSLPNSDVILGGEMYGTGAVRGGVAKFDANYNPVWGVRLLGQTQVIAVDRDDQNHIFALGMSNISGIMTPVVTRITDAGSFAIVDWVRHLNDGSIANSPVTGTFDVLGTGNIVYADGRKSTMSQYGFQEADMLLLLADPDLTSCFTTEGVIDSQQVAPTFTAASNPDNNVAIPSMPDGPNALDWDQMHDCACADCEAIFTFNLLPTGCLQYQFVNTSAGYKLTYHWDFGDGNTSTAQNPTHAYSTPGTYNVCLTVSNGECSDNLCTVIQVDAPVFTIQCPGNLQLTTDPGVCQSDVNPPAPIVNAAPCLSITVTCTRDDGQALNAPFQPGTTTLTCVATDQFGNSKSCSFTVTVTDVQPPQLVCDNFQIQTDAGNCEIATFTLPLPAATDNCTQAGGFTYSGVRDDGLPLNAPWPIGITCVNWIVTDQAGNTATCSGCVTVSPNPDASCAPFNCLHGDDQSNLPTKAKWINGNVYLAATNSTSATTTTTFATFSRYDNLGNLVWSVQLDSPSVITDFVATDDNAFLLVGRTPIVSAGGNLFTDNRSVLARIDLNGNLNFCRTFNNNGRETFNTIVRHPNPGAGNSAYYILGLENQTGTFNTRDRVMLYNVDNMGAINWKREFNTGFDDEYGRKMVLLANGNLLLLGSGNAGNPRGYYVIVNSSGGIVSDESEQTLFSSFQDALSLPNNEMVLAGRLTGPGAGLVKYDAQNNPLWGLRLTNQIDLLAADRDNNGHIFTLGIQNIGGIETPVVTQITDNGASATVDWIRHFNDGSLNNTTRIPATFDVLGNGNIVYAEGRASNLYGFLQEDILLVFTDLNFKNCFTQTLPNNSTAISPALSGFASTQVPPTIPQPLTYCQAPTWAQLQNCVCDTCSAGFTAGILPPDCFQYQFTNTSAGYNLMFTWDFGDGTTSTAQNPVHTFPGPGSYNVCLTVTNCDCTDTYCQTVQVTDPVLSIQCPAGLIRNTDPGVCYSDVDPPAPTVTADPCLQVAVNCTRDDGQPLNAPFQLGTTTLTCVATDQLGHSASCSFTVTVLDIEPPAIICPDPICQFVPPAQAGAIITYPPPAVTDNCGASVTCVPAPGSFFPLGQTTVVCTATDGAGNLASCAFIVEVKTQSSDSCCVDFDAFVQKVAAGFSVQRDACNILVQSAALDSCQQVVIEWGDGSQDGPFTGGATAVHTYNASGDYTVCATVSEIGPDGAPCFTQDTCWTVCVTCDTCDQMMLAARWERTYQGGGWDIFSDVTVAPNGDVYVIGNLSDQLTIENTTLQSADAKGDVMVAKFGPDGKISGGHLYRFGGNGGIGDRGETIKIAANGDIVIGGRVTGQNIDFAFNGMGANSSVSPGAINVTREHNFVARYNSNFELLWYHIFEGDKVMDLAFYQGNDIIAVGSTYLLGAPALRQNFIARYTPTQGVQNSWTQTSIEIFGGDRYNDNTWTVETDPAGGIYACGQFSRQEQLGSSPPLGATNYVTSGYVANLDVDGMGKLSWKWAFDILKIPNTNQGGGVAFAIDVDYPYLFVIGNGGEYLDPTPNNAQTFTDPTGGIYLAKYKVDKDPTDPLSNSLEWGFSIPRVGNDFNDIKVDGMGNLLITGQLRGANIDLDPNTAPNAKALLSSNGPEQDFFIAKYTDIYNGKTLPTFVSAVAVGGPAPDASYGMDVFDGNIYIAGALHHNPFPTFVEADPYLGKFRCECPADLTACCDDLSITAQAVSTSPACCYAFDMQNGAGFDLYQLEVELLEKTDWTINTGSVTLAGGFFLVNSSGSGLTVGHTSGKLPAGTTPGFLNICLASLINPAAKPQTLVFRWYEKLHDGSERVACADTVQLDCKSPVDAGPCAALSEVSVSCDPDNPLEYTLTFRVTNQSSVPLDAYEIFLQNINPGFGFHPCGGSGFQDPVYLQPSPLPLQSGQTSAPLCVKISASAPVLTTTPVCFQAGLSGLDQFCLSPTSYCVDLEPCCSPCGDIAVSSHEITFDSAGCCYGLDLENNCKYLFFNKIELAIQTPGIGFGTQTLGDPVNWQVCNSTPTTVCVSHQSGYIPTGVFPDVIQFCLNDVDPGESPQIVLFNYYTQAADGSDSLACTDTLSFSCSDSTGQSCLSVSNVQVECQAGKYLLNFSVENLSNPPFTAHAAEIIALEPGVVVTPNPIPIPGAGLKPGDPPVALSAMLTTSPFPDPDGQTSLLFRLLYAGGDSSCIESTEQVVMLPACAGCDCDSLEFPAGFGFSLQRDGCNVLVTPESAGPCQQVFYQWGDGTQSGPISGTGAATHAYTASGDYTICATVNLVDDLMNVCDSRDTCWTLCITCDTCDQKMIEPVWQREFADGKWDIFADVTVAPDGEVYVIGTHRETLDIDGKVLTAQDPQGAVVMAKFHPDGTLSGGHAYGFGCAAASFIGSRGETIKIAPNGDVVIGGRIGNGDVDFAVNGLASGVPAGYGKVFVTKEHNFVARYNLNFELLWYDIFPGDKVMDIAFLQGNDIIAVGSTFEETPGNSNLRQNFIRRYEPSGNQWTLDWKHIFGGAPYNDNTWSVETDPVGGIYVCGEFSNQMTIGGKTLGDPAYVISGYIANLNAAGVFQWVFDIPKIPATNQGGGVAFAIALDYPYLFVVGNGSDRLDPTPAHSQTFVDPTGGIYLAQYKVDTDPTKDPKNLKWGFSIPKVGNDFNDIKLDGMGNLLVTGQLKGDAIDFDPDSAPNADALLFSNMGEQDFFIAKYTDLYNGSKLPKYVDVIGVGGPEPDVSYGMDVFNGSIYIAGALKHIPFPAFSEANPFLGKFHCICPGPGIPEACCDALSVSAQGADADCCTGFDLQNDGGFDIANLEVELLGVDWAIGSASVPVGFTLSGSGNLRNIKHLSGTIPGGKSTGFLNLCLDPLTSPATTPQTLVFRWYERLPDQDIKVVCTDTITLNCSDATSCCLDFNGITAVDPFNTNNGNVIAGFDFVDFDNDGDHDMSSYINVNGVFKLAYRENTGNNNNPNFATASTSLGFDFKGAHYDFDYSGTGKDFFQWSTSFSGTDNLYYYRHSGTPNTVAYTEKNLGSLGFVNNNIGSYFAIGDLSNDGIPDLVVVSGKIVHYLEGGCVYPNDPCFGVPKLFFVTPQNGTEFPVPEIFDADCDGDLDLFIALAGEVRLFLNKGTVVAPGAFPDLDMTPLSNPYGISGLNSMTEFPVARFVDIDADGKSELFIRDANTIKYLDNCVSSCCDIADGIFRHNIEAVFNHITANGPTAIIRPATLDDCDQITYHWGDGSPSTTETGNAEVTHTYPSATGNYMLCIEVVRQETGSPAACKQDSVCQNISVATKQALKNSPQVYPNPTTGRISIDFEYPLIHDHRLRLLDPAGRQVDTRTLAAGQDRFRIHFENLPAGMYLLEFKDRNGRTEYLKLVLEPD